MLLAFALQATATSDPGTPRQARASVAGVLDRSPDGQPLFKGPVAVRCHPDGRLFVVDDLGHRIFVFNQSGALGQTLGDYGTGSRQLMWPDAIHWDVSGNLYVADTGARRIQVWDAKGAYTRELGGATGWRTVVRLIAAAVAVVALAALLATYLVPASRPFLLVSALVAGLLAVGAWVVLTVYTFGGVRSPRDVLVGPDGLVYVSDYGSDAVWVFTRAGAFVRSIGLSSDRSSRLRKPLGLAFASDGRLFVVDAGNRRVQVFASDGTFVRTLGAGDFDSPHGVAIGPDGLLYVADRGNRRVRISTMDGDKVADVIPDEDSRTFAPAGLCVAADGALVVADLETHRVVILARRW